jgi:hypothetical protein
LNLNLQSIMRDVPEYQRFPTVDEMHAELDEVAGRYPDLVRLRRIGTSRLGEPLRVLSVGEGPQDIVILGGPHPNEPIGALTVSALIGLLCTREELRQGRRWHLLPCADPDGARLNEGWYVQPGDRRAYARHFYRPAGHDQVEWTFPLVTEDYSYDAPMPETEALMRLMDEVKPAFVYSLHNGEYQGAYFYVNRDAPELADRLSALPGLEGIPLHHGDPEMPGLTTIAPAVFQTPTGAQQAKIASNGAGSADYAARYGALHLVTELPYWADPRVADQSPTSQPYATVLKEGMAAQRDTLDILLTVLDGVRDDLTVHSPFRRCIEDFFRIWARYTDTVDGLPEVHRNATVAEVFSNRQMVHLIALRYGGTLLRMLEAEAAAGNLTPAIRTQQARLQAEFERWCDEAEADSAGSPIELRRLVAVQVAAALVATSTL